MGTYSSLKLKASLGREFPSSLCRFIIHYRTYPGPENQEPLAQFLLSAMLRSVPCLYYRGYIFLASPNQVHILLTKVQPRAKFSNFPGRFNCGKIRQNQSRSRKKAVGASVWVLWAVEYAFYRMCPLSPCQLGSKTHFSMSAVERVPKWCNAQKPFCICWQSCVVHELECLD